MLIWIGFSISIFLLLYLSRRSLPLGMAAAALSLAAFTLSPGEFLNALYVTFTDPSVILLTIIVGLIPMIGGALETSGQMDRLVANMRIGVRPFMALAPALLGLLPMPGGALLSAPLLERGAAETPTPIKMAANVWFRHALLLIYPVGPTLIASAKIASLDVYTAIPALIPPFILSLLLGYWFLLRRVEGRVNYSGTGSLRELLPPLLIIGAAPGFDLLTKSIAPLPYPEIGTITGVGLSLILAVAIGRLGPAKIKTIFWKMRPWKFALIILAMFTFLNVFKISGAPESLAALQLPPVILCVVVGFLLGLITGRIQTPISIIVPIFLITYGAMSPVAFAITYFAIYLGYLITPIHPCVSVTVEYFSSSMPAFLRQMALPTTVAAVVTLIAGIFIL
ncbi:MAG: DUF401 family protein [Candidatus Bipolaricaulota bacterium]|nr:DUF401 family protein [Candidatus Bipolaricaulota bacterium]